MTVNKENISIKPAIGKKSLFKLRLYVDGKELPWQNIQTLTIREYIYDAIPRFKLAFTDDGFFSTDNPICEGQTVEVIAALNEDSKNIINQKFKVLSSSMTKFSVKIDNIYLITIDGILKTADSLNNSIKNTSYKQKTFSSVVEDIANINGISSNIALKSKDKMNWFQTNSSYIGFLNDSIYKSSAGQGDTPFCYFDRNGVLNYNSIKTSINKSSDIILTYSPNEVSKGNLTNDNTLRYFTSYTYADLSGYFNVYGGGSGIKYSYFKGDKFNSVNSKEYKATGLSSYMNKSKEDFNEPTKYYQFGTWNKANLYDDYYDTIIRNQILRGSILSNNLVVSVQPNNYSLLDKINIEIKDNTKDSLIKRPYSGDYLIGGIVHNFSNSGQYAQMLICFRDGMNGSDTFNDFENPLKKV